MQKQRTRTKHGQYQRSIEIPLDRLREYAKGLYTQASLAALLGVSHDTLSRRLQEPQYRQAFEEGRAEGCAVISNLQMKAARAGNIAMLIWLGKQHLGQKEMAQTQFGGSDGPLQIEIVRVVARSEIEAPAAEPRLNGGIRRDET